jgi:uncharacterized protein YbbC (DUF1343 family)
MLIGLDVLLKKYPEKLKKFNFALLANSASVNRDYRYTWDILLEKYPTTFKSIFSPQHGLWQEQQANMIESSHTKFKDLPVYSLYSETRKPTPEMLNTIDAVVVDLQDVGTRVYTFIWTLYYCLQSAAEKGFKVIVLDRPNPIGGNQFEGPILDKKYTSFVGLHPIPMRHGLTMGEIAQLFVAELNLDVDLEIVPMEGWKKSMYWNETGFKWIATSPNVPTWETCIYYPGTVILEGTNLSEGRGSTLPFEVIGAPFIDAYKLVEEMQKYNLKGVKFLPTKFIPTFDKWMHQSCGAVRLVINDIKAFEPYKTTLAVMAEIKNLYGNKFEWLGPPYEYEAVKMPIDILTGDTKVRALFQKETIKPEDINEVVQFDKITWEKRIKDHLIY